MSIAAFYQHKAQQCERMATAAADPAKRASLREEGKLWREIAWDVARQDRAESGLP